MFTLILGGAASGKSEYAESLCVHTTEKKLYVATMQPFGSEAIERIARHHHLRSTKGFDTLEKYVQLEEFADRSYHTILVECLSNLVANEFFSYDNFEDNIKRGINSMASQCQNFILVSNKVFSDGYTYEPLTIEYTHELASLNQYFAAKADSVIEVVYGIPVALKGSFCHNSPLLP
ncbi:bifunctional adenosylcobinamide kinase/adenosylcobinamide-phosphate guanylyltransferase [Candidatus Epulonipiscium viviparus]|uniref:bifunctional adenosylcobinamide kinase/adenosylcobinamide-phosphate guanylyltransferase n=1 Tax=Candidatus Epulonipiscium viviparus TaxID=420336 RepID=UPI00016C0C9C|nr:bifunctional adenosylcobinamide kinase/adenosylcobinamide-phosphate guanylyltransferase [Candidatus Epulopiscium viviparus]